MSPRSIAAIPPLRAAIPVAVRKFPNEQLSSEQRATEPTSPLPLTK
jgi:hypothetical protein